MDLLRLQSSILLLLYGANWSSFAGLPTIRKHLSGLMLLALRLSGDFMEKRMMQSSNPGTTFKVTSDERVYSCAVANCAPLKDLAEPTDLISGNGSGASRRFFPFRAEGEFLGLVALVLTPVILLSDYGWFPGRHTRFTGVTIETIGVPILLAGAVVSLHILIAIGKRLKSGLSLFPETWRDVFPTSVVLIDELDCTADEAFARCLGGLCRNLLSRRALDLDLNERRITGKVCGQEFEINLQEHSNGKSLIMMHVAHGRGGGLNSIAAIDFGLVELVAKRFLKEVRSPGGSSPRQ